MKKIKLIKIDHRNSSNIRSNLFQILMFLLFANLLNATQNLNYGIYSFENLLNHTLANSPRANISRLQIDEALLDYDYALSNFYPTLYVGANSEYSKRFDENYNSIYVGESSLSSSTTYQNSLSLGLRYDLFKFGADYYHAKSAKTHIYTTTFQKCADEIEISLNLLENYYKALNLKNKISTNEELKEIYATLLEYSKRLNEVGESDKISISEYKIALSELKTQIQSLKEEAKFTLNNIYQITAVAIDDLKFLSEFNTEEISKNLNFLDFEDTYISQKLQAELRENELMLKSLQKAYYPTISLYAKYDFYGSDRDDYRQSLDNTARHGYRVGVSFNWEIFDGGRRKANIDKQKTRNQMLEFQKQDEKLRYEKQIKDIEVFLENEKDMRENLNELYNDTTKAKNYIARLNESGEKSKIELLNSLIKTIQKKQDLSEHILEAKFMLLKGHFMANQNGICER